MTHARPVTRVGRVWSGFGFLVIIFGLSRVGSGYFLSSGENFDPRVSITRKLFLVFSFLSLCV
jgi:hypothetical protein